MLFARRCPERRAPRARPCGCRRSRLRTGPERSGRNSSSAAASPVRCASRRTRACTPRVRANSAAVAPLSRHCATRSTQISRLARSTSQGRTRSGARSQNAIGRTDTCIVFQRRRSNSGAYAELCVSVRPGSGELTARPPPAEAGIVAGPPQARRLSLAFVAPAVDNGRPGPGVRRPALTWLNRQAEQTEVEWRARRRTAR
jgi:hypothetical protein